MAKRGTRRRPTAAGVLLSLLVGILLGVGAWTFHTARAASYLHDDPEACTNCHVMRDAYHAWERSSHRAWATCNDCHVPHDGVLRPAVAKATSGVRHAWAFTFGPVPDTIRAHASSRSGIARNCVRCHAALVGALAAAAARGRHGEGTESDDPDCLRCHARAGHAGRR